MTEDAPIPTPQEDPGPSKSSTEGDSPRKAPRAGKKPSPVPAVPLINTDRPVRLADLADRVNQLITALEAAGIVSKCDNCTCR